MPEIVARDMHHCAQIVLQAKYRGPASNLVIITKQTEKGSHESTSLVSMWLKAIPDMLLRSKSVRSCENRFR